MKGKGKREDFLYATPLSDSGEEAVLHAYTDTNTQTSKDTQLQGMTYERVADSMLPLRLVGVSGCFEGRREGEAGAGYRERFKAPGAAFPKGLAGWTDQQPG